jgi:2-methylcitrate dehydratase PrpD
MTHALAIAGSHASGTMEYDQSGGEVKRMHSGMACSGGLRSAMLAEMGLTGPPTIFEGKRGILKVFGGESITESITRDLGSECAVLHAAIKRFPVNASQHSPIELLDELVRENRFAPEEVRKIEVGVNEGVILHGGTIYEPKEVIEAQFSLRFSLAVRLLKGSNSLETYLDPNVWRDPRILETAKKIELFSDPTAMRERRFACSMKIKLASGRIIEGALSSPKGTHKNPFSKSEVQEKFFRLGSRALPEEKLNRVIEKVEMIEREDDVSSIIPLLIVEHRD